MVIGSFGDGGMEKLAFLPPVQVRSDVRCSLLRGSASRASGILGAGAIVWATGRDPEQSMTAGQAVAERSNRSRCRRGLRLTLPGRSAARWQDEPPDVELARR